MNSPAINRLVFLCSWMVAAVVLGFILGSGETFFLLLLVYLGVFAFALVVPGHIPLLALGLTSPFILPLPFVHAMPLLLIILGLLALRHFFQNLIHKPERPGLTGALNLIMGLFFGWVLLRYAIKPVMPNLGGVGASVTGFRAYLNYGLCLGLLLLLPQILRQPEDFQRLLQWMGRFCLVFILLLVPMVFSKSAAVGDWLSRFGVTVTTFDNGFLRLVALPPLGVILVSLACLKRLWPLRARWRWALGLIGVLAVFASGSRSGVIQLFACMLGIFFYQRLYRAFALGLLAGALAWGALYLVGENIRLQGNVGFLRILSVASPRMAKLTNAEGTYLWRKVRWNRGIEEIKRNPWLGKGYGGLENAWIYDEANFEQARLEVDLAAGGMHNGFLACAYALGLPALLLFAAAFGRQIVATHQLSCKHQISAPAVSEIHVFLGANLAGLAPAIYVGYDLNHPLLWFLIGAGVLLARLAPQPACDPLHEPQAETAPAAVRNWPRQRTGMKCLEGSASIRRPEFQQFASRDKRPTLSYDRYG